MTAGLLAGSAASASQAPAAQRPAVQQVTPFQEQAAKLGVRKCANLFTALGQTVTHGSTYSVQTHADKTAPDARSAQAVIGMNYNRPDYRAQAAGIVIAAPVGPTCEGQMVRVAPFQQPCPQVVGLLPKGSTLGGNMSGVPLYNLAGNQGQALLVASGSSCVVVTVTQAVQTQ
ncbi:MAG TPA: hypothetical protein VEB39_01330 [Sphingomicrobium sp.]|nr:hypothetical protein [Sphingomicrobium sp.]